MSVLVTTTDGYHIFTSSGKHLRSLDGHRVESFTPGPDGTFLAVIDRHEVWSHGSDGEWTPLAKAETTLTAVVAAGDAVFAGTDDARVLRLSRSGAFEALAGFDTVAGRDEWHQVGSPLQVRTMTATADDGRGARQRARRRHPALGRRRRHVAADRRGRRRRAPGPRASDATRDRGGGRVRGPLSQSRRWRDVDVDHRRDGDDLRGAASRSSATTSSSPCPTARGHRARPSTAHRSTVVPWHPVTGGLGELHGNVDSRCIASDGTVRRAGRRRRCRVAFGRRRSRDSNASPSGLDGVTGVTVA